MEEYINSIGEFYLFIIILYIFTFIADHVDILSEYLITLPVMRSGVIVGAAMTSPSLALWPKGLMFSLRCSSFVCPHTADDSVLFIINVLL